MVGLNTKSTKRMIAKIKEWEGDTKLKITHFTKYTDEDLKDKTYDELFEMWNTLDLLWKDQNQ